jgi:hypothetical protein
MSMQMRSVAAGAAVAAAAMLAACGSATGGGGGGGEGPAPEAGREARDGGGRGTTVSYRPPFRATYAMAWVDSAVMQLPSGQSAQTFDRTMYITAAVQGGAGDSNPVTIVLDSIVAAPNPLVPTDSIEAAEGTRWTGTLSERGKLSALSASRSSAVGEQIGGMLQILFPTLPEDGARAGATWSDTLVTTKTAPFEVEERSVVRYTAADPAPGARGLRVTAEAAVTQTGSGQQFGQAMELQATGARRLEYVLEADGRLAGVTGTDSTEMVINVPAVGQSVPVRTVGRVTITPVGAPAGAAPR